MDIHGLQKLTLLDFPGRVACTVFLQGCDLRCPFCHNGGLVLGGMEPVMDDAGLLDFLRKRQGLLDGVAVTGGEPLLRSDLPPLLRAVKDLGYAVKLDTNGSHPAALRALVEEGKLTGGHARALVPLTAEMQQKAAAVIVKDDLSVRQTELLVKKLTAEKKDKPAKDPTAVDYAAEAARELGERLGRPCKIVTGKKKGRIELEYFGMDDLNALLEALHQMKK